MDKEPAGTAKEHVSSWRTTYQHISRYQLGGIHTYTRVCNISYGIRFDIIIFAVNRAGPTTGS